MIVGFAIALPAYACTQVKSSIERHVAQVRMVDYDGGLVKNIVLKQWRF